MRSLSKHSLRGFFRRRALQWSAVGFGLILPLAVFCLSYTTRIASERQLETQAQAVAMAFRERIIEDEDIRDTQFQIRNLLKLEPGDSALIRDPQLHVIYEMGEKASPPLCTPEHPICWSRDFKRVGILYPIYYDGHEQQVKAYLELVSHPAMDHRILYVLIALSLAAFLLQVLGLSTALSRSATVLTEQLAQWAAHLAQAPSGSPDGVSSAPFEDLEPMQQAMQGLHAEVQRLQQDAAQKATVAAQASILSEIGHDLKTPLSQLAKAFALHIDTVRTQGNLDEAEVDRVERAMRRMGDMLRQVRMLHYSESNGSTEDHAELLGETRIALGDLQTDPEVLEKGVRIILDAPSDDTVLVSAQISKLGYYRILENLIRNAVHAVSPGTGEIVVTLSTLTDGRPVLSVKDNGSGIPAALQGRVFDFDFTTKPRRGTGLGLGIVKRICSEAGAAIQFQSAPGLGTTFTVVFVQAPEHKSSSEPSHLLVSARNLPSPGDVSP